MSGGFRLLALWRRTGITAVELFRQLADRAGKLFLRERVERFPAALLDPGLRLSRVEPDSCRQLKHLTPHRFELPRFRRCRYRHTRVCDSASVVQTVPELVSEIAERALEGVRDRSLIRGLVCFGCVGGDETASRVAPRCAPADGHPHYGAVHPHGQRRLRVRIGEVDWPEADVAHQLGAPAVVAEDAIGLVDDSPTLQVMQEPAVAGFPLGDE